MQFWSFGKWFDMIFCSSEVKCACFYDKWNTQVAASGLKSHSFVCSFGLKVVKTDPIFQMCTFVSRSLELYLIPYFSPGFMMVEKLMSGPATLQFLLVSPLNTNSFICYWCTRPFFMHITTLFLSVVLKTTIWTSLTWVITKVEHFVSNDSYPLITSSNRSLAVWPRCLHVFLYLLPKSYWTC